MTTTRVAPDLTLLHVEIPTWLHPCHDSILIQRVAEHKGKIITPDVALKDNEGIGVVVAVGPGALAVDGITRRTMSCKVGDVIRWWGHAAKFRSRGVDYFVVQDANLACVIDPEPDEMAEREAKRADGGGVVLQ